MEIKILQAELLRLKANDDDEMKKMICDKDELRSRIKSLEGER